MFDVSLFEYALHKSSNVLQLSSDGFQLPSEIGGGAPMQVLMQEKSCEKTIEVPTAQHDKQDKVVKESLKDRHLLFRPAVCIPNAARQWLF